jgi:hypothetical protein
MRAVAWANRRLDLAAVLKRLDLAQIVLERVDMIALPQRCCGGSSLVN